MAFLILFLLELILLFFFSRELTKSLSTLFYRFTKNQHTTVHILAFLFLPGVVVHELAHLLVANLLLVKTGHIEFVPQISSPPAGGGVKLGSVVIAKTDPVRRMLIGVAPVFVGLAILLGGFFYFLQPCHSEYPPGHLRFISESQILKQVQDNKTCTVSIPFWQVVILFYFLFVVSNTMFSSRKDMEGALELFMVILIVGVLAYVLGAHFDFSLLQGILVSKEGFLQRVVVMLSLPIAVDMGVWGLVSVMGHLGQGYRRSL